MTIIASPTCTHCSQPFDILQEDRDFYDKISPRYGAYTATIPNPTLCPDCRQRRRLSFRNERKLYRRSCDASNKQIISIYSPDKKYTVYDQKIRRWDSRDPMDFGRDFDFSRTFTEQFGELMSEVPRPSLHIDLGVKSVNSEYTNEWWWNKSCYLVFKTWYAQNSMYSTSISGSEDCIDCLNIENSQNCYECTYCKSCYECYYCVNCIDCSYCYWSNGLTWSEYVYKNIQLDKEKYFDKMKDIVPVKRMMIEKNVIVNCENSSGNNLYDCKNCHHCFDVSWALDCKYCYWFIPTASDCYDVHVFWDKLTRSIELEVWWTNSDMVAYSIHTNSCSHIHFNHFATHSSHLFGCIWLRNKSYCILNKQYTKEEYNILVPKIIQHMQQTWERGEFFHPSLSPFGYNETVAQEYFPVSDISELAPHGYHRSEYNKPTPNVQNLLDASKLPSIQNATDEICRQAIQCEASGEPFRIIKQELEFYRKHNLPLPTKHPNVRHSERMSLRR